MDYNHTRILRIRLILIESHLRSIISELGRSDANNLTFILYSIRNDVSFGTRTEMLSTVNSMLDEIRQMKENFALESEEQSIRKDVLGHLNGIWTTLEDTIPEKLAKGYGNMSKFDEELLRPYILKLLSLVDDIYNELG
jgi:hypothetical protein